MLVAWVCCVASECEGGLCGVVHAYYCMSLASSSCAMYPDGKILSRSVTLPKEPIGTPRRVAGVPSPRTGVYLCVDRRKLGLDQVASSAKFRFRLWLTPAGQREGVRVSTEISSRRLAQGP